MLIIVNKTEYSVFPFLLLVNPIKNYIHRFLARLNQYLQDKYMNSFFPIYKHNPKVFYPNSHLHFEDPINLLQHFFLLIQNTFLPQLSATFRRSHQPTTRPTTSFRRTLSLVLWRRRWWVRVHIGSGVGGRRYAELGEGLLLMGARSRCRAVLVAVVSLWRGSLLGGVVA